MLARVPHIPPATAFHPLQQLFLISLFTNTFASACNSSFLRPRGRPGKMSHKAAIAQLRAQRLAGKTRLETYQIEDQGAIYDEVDEDGYKKVVRSRLDQDDFVVDDNGEGYADDGREEWQNERQYYSSDDAEDVPLKGNASKRKREETREKDERTNHKILNYFNNAPVTAPKPKVGRSIASLQPDQRL